MRRELVWIGLSAGLLSALAVLAYGCGQTSSGSCADNGTCPASQEAGADAVAGADADAGDGSDAYPCDPTKTPSEDSCVVGNMYGVFVSPSGHDGAAGNMGDPFLKVADAIAAATGHTDRVLACAGSYDEALTLGSSPGADAGSEDGGSFAGGVTVFGGLDCAHGWAYTGARAVLAPTTPGTALTVKGLTVGVTFEDFGFQALPGTNPGESSIAVFASQSAGLTLVRCELVAGAGQPGQDQVAVMGFDAGAPSGQPGTANNGGGSTTNACVPTASVGNVGGRPLAGGDPGAAGLPAGTTNTGGTAAQCLSSTGGGPGANGASGSAGSGASSWASFDQNGWVPAAGTPGGAGGVGQGGGGGASVDTSGGGGGGGAGGCGGVGGTAGTGGGSSIALLVYQSSVDLEQCTISVAGAGKGGNGATGQAGQSSGGHGNGYGNTACSGGNGGNGGNGGGGGGGAGGLSVGVLWTGTSPTIDGSPVGQASPLDAGPDAGTLAQVTLGVAGAAGAGGTAAGSADAGAGGDGIPGIVAAVLQFQ